MFDAIAPRYDLLNHVLSAGIDKRSRTRAMRSLALTGTETLLDVCTGTGDLALEGRRQGAARVLGVDFAGAMLAIGLWVGGFDILYACQDVEFDRGYGLRSIPTRFGVAASIQLSRVMHAAAVLAMAALWWVAALPALYLVGVVIVAILLVYEQSLVSEDDLSQVKKAFDLNGYVGIVYFGVTALSLYVG